MSSPFQDLSVLCHSYTALFAEFRATQACLDQLNQLASGQLTEEQYREHAAIAQARISLLTPDNDMIVVELPISRKLLTMAVEPLSEKLGAVTKEIQAKAAEAIKMVEEVLCRTKQATPASVPASGTSQPPSGSTSSVQTIPVMTPPPGMQ